MEKIYRCIECYKNYNSYMGWWLHNKKYHPQKESQTKENTICKYCNGKYASRQSRWRHEQTCQKNIGQTEIKQFQPIQQIQSIIQTQPNPAPNKLFHKYEIPNSDLYVLMRVSDCYVNATQLCNIGKKIFAHWYYTDKTQKSIGKITIEKHNSAILIVKPLVEVTNFPDFSQEFWICPDLALELTKWISSILSIQLNQWIKSHNTTWSDAKKQPREQYLDKPVLYLITNDALKPHHIYIVGKSNNLTNRLSVYNKSCEHEVIYFQECSTESIMDIAEQIVLNKLDGFREKTNRDRFVLPDDKPIDFFINHISNAIDILET